jgi:hypothetical protein
MTAGTGDKKKLIALCVLGAFALYMVWANLLSGPSIPESQYAPRRTAQAPAAGADTALPSTQPTTRAANAARGGSEKEFVPVFRKKGDANKAPNLDGIDPTLRTDLLAKVQALAPAGGVRNLFEVGAAPPPKADAPKGTEPKIAVAKPLIGPKQPPPPPPPPPPAPPPPIPLKLYAVVTVRNTGKKTACFLDGENILTASEGDTVMRRYKLLQIRAKDVLMEDTEAKRQQTVPLMEEGQS